MSKTDIFFLGAMFGVCLCGVMFGFVYWLGVL